jgi:hypothetical protein
VDPTENFRYRARVKLTLFRLSFIPDKIGAGPGLSLSSTFSRKHGLMLWTGVAIAMGVGLTGRGLPLPCLQRVKIRACHQPHSTRASRSSPAPQGAGAVMAIPRGKPCPGLHASGNTGMRSQMTSCFVGHYRQPPPFLTARGNFVSSLLKSACIFPPSIYQNRLHREQVSINSPG